jgi:hypothetical protein
MPAQSAGHIKPKIFVGIASPQDSSAMFPFACKTSKNKLQGSDLVILEKNPNAPHTFGDLEVQVAMSIISSSVNYPIPKYRYRTHEKDLLIGK